MPTVYLLHFTPAYNHMQHYIGCTEKLPEDRLAEHVAGVGARVCKQAVAAGCKIEIARTWHNVPWTFEQQLKGRSAKPLCPICRGAGLSAEGG